VGYGDYSPTTPDEQIFTIAFMVIAAGVYASTLEKVGNIVR